MTEQAQVGDTVRLTITGTYQGVVEVGWDGLCVQGMSINSDAPNRTVEILSRATPPLPSEPGTWWLDNNGNIWIVDLSKLLRCVRYPRDKAEDFAPFRQLVLK